MITWVNVNGFSLGTCIDIVNIWFGIVNGQISSNFVSFPDDNLSKYQEIVTKLGTCIDIKEIWFGIANGQILSMFDKLSARDTILPGFIV